MIKTFSDDSKAKVTNDAISPCGGTNFGYGDSGTSGNSREIFLSSRQGRRPAS